MWQPSLDSLRNIEQDEAGRLRAFRQKFGRGWDVEGADSEGGISGGEIGGGQGEESLMDLISGAGNANNAPKEGEVAAKKDVEYVTVKKDGVLVKVARTGKK